MDYLFFFFTYPLLSPSIYTSVKVTVGAMTVRTDEEGLLVGWVAGSKPSLQSHQMVISEPTSADKNSYWKHFVMGKEGMRIPSSELSHLKEIELTIITIDHEGKPVVVKIHLKQWHIEGIVTPNSSPYSARSLRFH